MPGDGNPSPMVEVCVTEAEGQPCIAILQHHASVVEHEGELIPVVAITATYARVLAAALCAAAARIEDEC